MDRTGRNLDSVNAEKVKGTGGIGLVLMAPLGYTHGLMAKAAAP